MPKDNQPTYSEIIEQLLSDLDGPISANDFIERFFEIRVPGSKNPRASVRTKLREENGRSHIILSGGLILPINLAYEGIRFRVELTRKMLSKGLIPLEDFVPYLPPKTSLNGINFLDQDGTALDVIVIAITKKVKSLLGGYDQVSYHAKLNDWFKGQKARSGDHVLVTVHNCERKNFRLELEPKNSLNQEHLQVRNQELADILFGLLEQERNERLYLYVGIPTAYALLPDKKGYPPDTVYKIIADDPRMVSGIWEIKYSDSPPSMLERMLAGKLETPTIPALQKFSQVEGNQIYRFKAAFKHRKGLWRKIEIQGNQTLAEFNYILMRAFDHDCDHIGGFWKVMPRGGSKRRYREVKVGSVNPFGEGDGADTPIAGLGLEVGARLKYVYDFGDWIEHEITLEAITSPEEGVEYPQIAAQNKPRYKYCQSCKENDKKTIATWICFECSEDEQQQVLICEDCLEKYHEDHYADEIVY